MRISDWISDVCSSDLRNFPPELIEEISLVPFVEKIKPGEIGVARIPSPVSEAMAIPGFDPASLIFLEEAHAFSTGSPSIKIDILDTGIEPPHDEIKHAKIGNAAVRESVCQYV